MSKSLFGDNMRINAAKWVLPGIITVFLGTAGIIELTKTSIQQDLASAAKSALTEAGYDWAQVNFDARDAVVSGLAANPQLGDQVRKIVASMRGVRSVETAFQFSPTVSPYPFEIKINNGAIHFSGGVPEENMRAIFKEKTGGDVSRLSVMSGVPDRKIWLQAVDFAMRQSAYLDNGYIRIAGTTLSAKGRAASRNDYQALVLGVSSGWPNEVTRGSFDVQPPLISPYVWQASYDGRIFKTSGDVPSDSAEQSILSEVPKGAVVEASYGRASGEPSDFLKQTKHLVSGLSYVEKGEVNLTDKSAHFSGAPLSPEADTKLRALLDENNISADLLPPKVDNYWLLAKSDAEKISLSGFVPSTENRIHLAALQNVDISQLNLGRGAPKHFDASVDFGMQALALLSPGSFSLKGDALRLEGHAKSPDAYDQVQDIIANNKPENAILETAQIDPALVSPFVWSIVKNDTNTLLMSGYVPSNAIRQTLMADAGAKAIETVQIAQGAPEGFAEAAQIGVRLAHLLANGSVSYNGKQWQITGTAQNFETGTQMQELIADTKLTDKNWVVQLDIPKALVPTIAPYVFSAEKISSELKLAGYLPSQDDLDMLAAGDQNLDISAVQIGQGAPEFFGIDAQAGLTALAALDTGRLQLTSEGWLLNGEAQDAAAREQILKNLAAQSALSAWAVDVSIPEISTKTIDAVESTPETLTVEETVVEEAIVAPVDTAQAVSAINEAVSTNAEMILAEAPLQTETPVVIPKVAKSGDPAYAFSIKRHADGMTYLAGAVPQETTKTLLLQLLKDADADRLEIAPNAPNGFTAAASAGARALKALVEGELIYKDQNWSFKGKSGDAGARELAAVNLAKIAGSEAWEIDIKALTPIEICNANVALFTHENAILFNPGSDRLVTASMTVIDELAGYLKKCPNAAVHVEGHTDSDGDDNANLILSVSRAEAVVDELITRGIGADRLYAVGYGESLPIASNDTNKGKSLNRRIVFSILDDAQ